MFTSRDTYQFHQIKKSVIRKLRTDLVGLSYDHYSSRIKSPLSIRQKLKRKGFEPTSQNALQHLSDIIGIRLVTRYIMDIYQIVDRIHECCNVIEEHDYIATPKASGYRSYHMTISIPIPADSDNLQEGQPIDIEIQIRTMGMDFWASLEHSLVYKKGLKDNKLERNAALIQTELRHYAEDIFSIDMRLQALTKLTEE
jgi:putative GTP pyrophosphokinase